MTACTRTIAGSTGDATMQRTPGLDTLRAVAIVWVMLFHSYLVGGLGDGFGVLERSGWMGVDLFFVLSGYLIGTQVLTSLRDTGRLDLRAFYVRRATRILPAFLVVLALYACWPAWREVPEMQPLWQFLTFTFNLLVGSDARFAFSHVWSLCVEEHFYLVFPFLAIAMTRQPSTARSVALGVAVVLGGIGLRAWLWQHAIAPLRATGSDVGLAYLGNLYYPTWSRLDGLVAGVALAACAVYRPSTMARMRERSGSLLFAGATCLGAALILFDGARTELWPCVIGYPLIALAMALFVATASGGSWLARCDLPGAGWLARASYSLYLSHKGVFHLVDTGLDGHLDGHRFIRFAVYAVATLAGGAALHYAVERPVLRWRDRRRHASATMPVPKVIRGVSATD